VLTASDFSFEFREPASLPNPMLAMQDVACGYGETVIVRDVNRSVLAGQRIGILGANGQGKSTLVKTIARMQPALAGTLTEGKGLAIGYFAQQEMDLLHADDTPLQRMLRLAKEVSPQAREQELRDFLGQFRFVGDMVHQSVGSLSGGEKARLVLATIVWQRPNLLLLDEPTNHLDLNTREALSLALNEFEGTVLLVSHDRALLREVCDEFWLVAKGKVEPFDGDLDDYQRWLLENAREAQRLAKEAAAKPAEGPAPTRREDRKAAAQARARLSERTRPLKQELARAEAALAKLGEERSALEAALTLGTATPTEMAEQGRRLKRIGEETEALEERWLELHAELDTLAADS
ncbi:MAG TPA: ATP-binding cassette domain-containing protein, partial [Burkholderiaceae bacterium]|nr:ATP-binding cassette domain-containing protein [Burkholderiaceae bacterium]